MGRVFDVAELARLFRCSTEKIKRKARSRELPAFKFGKSWYVREQDLETYINELSNRM
jgi:excisionase family DNA binding protein